jgi:3-hydroxybutyryl-CoA dehydrogenase
MNEKKLPVVGVVGAGTMGAGIAQIAAAAGHEVWMLDAREGAAGAAIAKTADALGSLVTRGKLDAAARDATCARLRAASTVQDLAGCGVVVEAIVEDLDAKRALFARLESVVGEDAILATNTSSISVTAIANGLRRPQRLAGMHFFNPVPLMKLVEIVSGLATDRAVADTLFALAQAWGKVAVHARSTPGFIVNRIARPLYAETLALLHEQRATPAVIDACMRAAGFRMGPCELMDLIGHDVNFAVTQSVFAANFNDRRFVPSAVQQELVDGGLLGRKSGRGFYAYQDGKAVVDPLPAAPGETPVGSAVVHGQNRIADRLAESLTRVGMHVTRAHDEARTGVRLGALSLWLTDGDCAGHIAAHERHAAVGVFDLPLDPAGTGALAVAFAHTCPDEARQLGLSALAACGWQPLEISDTPGLVVARTIAMLVNEAADAVQQGVCSPEAADLAMKLGTNYPAGPFEWLQALGVPRVLRLLGTLARDVSPERYRASPWLRERGWAAGCDD